MKFLMHKGKILSFILCLLLVPNAFSTEYSASFKNADINEFINIVGKNLHKTIIIDPAVRGKINVRSYDLLNEDQYYQFFLNVLEVYGFATVETADNVIKVIRAKDAKVAAIPVVDDGEIYKGDEMVTRVVPVLNVSVRELAPLLRQLNDNAGGGNVVHYGPSNVLMITGRAAVVNRLVEIVHRVDKAGNQDVDIIKLKYASALDLVNLITEIQTPAKGSSSNIPSILKPHVVADERTNSIIISGDPKTRSRIIALVKELDNELKSNGNTRVFYLKYAKAEEVADVLKGISDGMTSVSSGSNNKSSTQDGLAIESHEGTNAIIISAQPALMASLSSVIRQLDIRRAQVLVEAIIVEITEGHGINLSVQFATPGGGTQFLGNGGLTTGDAINSMYTINNNDGGDLSDVGSALSKIDGGIIGYIGSNWGVMLQAISRTTGSNILSTPSIMTLDNQEASFLVGDEVPVLTGSTSSSDNDNPFQTIERKDIGVKLNVTPQINEGDSVQLLIEQEVSSIKDSTNTVDVVFSTRSIKTTVLVKSGQTIVLGGLIDDKVIESVDKVPILGDIPWLGNLFKSTINSTEKRNLMIFLRATIIRDEDTMNKLSMRKYSLMRSLQKKQRDIGITFMPNEQAPILPKWKTSKKVDVDGFVKKGKSLKPGDDNA